MINADDFSGLQRSPSLFLCRTILASMRHRNELGFAHFVLNYQKINNKRQKSFQDFKYVPLSQGKKQVHIEKTHKLRTFCFKTQNK